jgi:pimeloyl-ACP methyl ester carboxylesterase
MPTIELPTTRLCYLDTGPPAGHAAGTAPTIVLLHANTGTSASWTHQLTYFSAAGHRVLALDRCGWGDSRPVRSRTCPSEAGHLRDLLRALDLPPCHLIATAGGAFGAIEHAAASDGSVRSLTVLASMGTTVLPEVRAFADRIGLRRGGIDLPAAIRELSAGYRGSDPEGARRWADIAASARNGWGGAHDVPSRNDDETLARIGVPTLAVAGGADLISPPALMRLWAARIPRARLEVVAEAGHAVAWEQPDRVNEIVHEFLRELPA